MDTKSFLGIEPSGESSDTNGRWSMQVRPALVTGRSCIWATGQYLSYARLNETMDIDVTLAVVGHQITQARAVGRVGEREILTVNAALGQRVFEKNASFTTMPDVPMPSEIATREHRHPIENTIHERLDERLVKGRDLDELDGVPNDGHTIMWARIPDVLSDVDAATLAVLGDFVPMAIGQALGVRGGGNSLDNTIRIVRLVPTKWVLLDIQIQGVERGFGHGTMNMFAEDGTLLATASQSVIARMWKEAKL
jgi:acyl-CoA thioesterase